MERNYLVAFVVFCGSSNFTLGAGASGVSAAEVTGLALAAGCTGETSGVTGVAGVVVAGAAGASMAGAGFVTEDFDGVEAGASEAGFGVGAAEGGMAAKPRSSSSIQ